MEAQKHVRAHTGASHSMVCRMLSLIFVTKAPREGPHRVSLGYQGGCRGGGGLGPNWWVFPAIPHLELGKTLLPNGPDFGPFG